MYQVASTASSGYVVAQPSTVLVAQPAQTLLMAQQPVPVPGGKAEEPAAAEAAPPRIDPACLCFFALLSSLLLLAVSGWWTANFLLSNEYAFSMESYKNSSITWGFQNFQTKVIPSQFVPIGIKLLWWIFLGVAAIYGMLAVACQSRCNILLVCLFSLSNVIFFAILTADEGQTWNNAETSLRSQWKDEISSSRFNFRGTGLSRIQYEYSCCGIDDGCTDFGATKDSVWLNTTVGSGCFSMNCNTPCGPMIKQVRNNLLFPFIVTLVALILQFFLFLSALSMANQLAQFTACFTVEPAPVE